MKRCIYFCTLLLLSSCSKNEVGDQNIPSLRSFYMGFTAFPYAFSLEALNDTYENVSKDGDILLTHSDSGVPWEEALIGNNFPAVVSNTLQEAIESLGPKQKLFLTATPTSTTRNTLAPIWNDNGEQQILPDYWASKKFNDPDVINAYINYCEFIINYASPDYFAYAIEINNSFEKGSGNLAEFLELAEAVYTRLKTSFPDLPIMVTLQDHSFEISKSDQISISQELLKFSDYVAMSTYPYLTASDFKRDANPALFPNDWLKEFRDLAPEKPFAISETAFIAETIELESVDIKAKGKEEWQRDYLQKLMVHANDMKAEFVIWFIYRDYDAIYDLNPNDVFRIWRDTGLKDEAGRERESYELWKEWMEVDRE